MPNEKHRKIGRNWEHRFIQSNINIVQKIKPKRLLMERQRNSCWEIILPFYYKYITLKNERKYLPQLILNFDEVSLSSSKNSNQYIVALNGFNINSIPEELSTPSCSSLRTVVLVDHTNVPDEFAEVASESVRFIYSPLHGWMTATSLEHIFLNILLPVINQRRSILGNSYLPCLIVVDGHSSRFSSIIFQISLLENIDIICIPSHTSHILQPLDCSVNGIFKSAMDRFVNYKSVANIKEKRRIYVDLLKESISNSLNSSTIKKSWKMSGLYPFNPFVALHPIPIFPPPYLNEKFSRETINSISGKVLVKADMNYSINNEHTNSNENILNKIKTSVNELLDFLTNSNINNNNIISETNLAFIDNVKNLIKLKTEKIEKLEKISVRLDEKDIFPNEDIFYLIFKKIINHLLFQIII
jgi:hypothetical protein